MVVVAQGSVDVAAVGGNGTTALVVHRYAHRIAEQHLLTEEGLLLAKGGLALVAEAHRGVGKGGKNNLLAAAMIGVSCALIKL